MNITKNIILILVTLIISSGMFSAGVLEASTEKSAESTAPGNVRPGEKYLPSDNAMADLTAAIDTARDNYKRVLVVMGANWCHDSRSLASRLETKPLSTLVDQYYETLFVDVGYLEKGKDVITSLGVPVYYATPTVLIVDPVSGQLVNADNRQQWGHADSISMEESIAYFELMANADPSISGAENEPSEELQTLLADINAFEQVQADRLYEAYSVIGPMLKAYESGERDKFSDKDWNKVREFRSRVPADIAALKAEAFARVAGGEQNIKLKYPKYRAFRWEKKKH